MSEVSVKVKGIIIDVLCVHSDTVVPEANFKEDLGADSLEVIELIMELEKEFNISIPDEVSEKINTVQEAITCIEERVGNKK